MAITKDIKRRIKSVGNTKKVTKAMEMVAAAKMRRAVNSVLMSRSYANLAWSLLQRLAAKTETSFHPLLIKRDRIKNIGLVLVTGNRGLCGGFNAQIIQKTVSYINQQKNNGRAVSLILLGKKGSQFMAKRGYHLIAEFEKLDIIAEITEIRPIAKLLINDYITGKFDKVVLAYTDYISTLVQKPKILDLLPIISDGRDVDLGDVELSKTLDPRLTGNLLDYEYLFEPSPFEVLNELLPRFLEMQIYQALLESTAAEHSARMVAMRNASDAASEIIDDLTLMYNKARQASITAELADISGGRAALE